jgi:hypothetical protein
MHKQAVKGLLFFFALPIVMIGFPTIQSIKIGAEGVEIDNQTTALQDNPQDEASRNALASKLNDFKNRTFKNPQAVATIARAEFALGQDADAKQNMQKALSADPDLKTAQDLKARMEAASKLSELAAAAEKQPANPEIKQQLETAVQNANQYKFANPQAVASLRTAAKLLKPEQMAGGQQKN